MRRYRVRAGESIRLPPDREQVRTEDGIHIYRSRSMRKYYYLEQTRKGDWLVEEVSEEEYCDEECE